METPINSVIKGVQECRDRGTVFFGLGAAGKSANRTQLEQAYTAESQSSDTGHDHQYADRIIAILRDAQRNGVDVESELRCRLRDLECAIERIESENR